MCNSTVRNTVCCKSMSANHMDNGHGCKPIWTSVYAMRHCLWQLQKTSWSRSECLELQNIWIAFWINFELHVLFRMWRNIVCHYGEYELECGIVWTTNVILFILQIVWSNFACCRKICGMYFCVDKIKTTSTNGIIPMEQSWEFLNNFVVYLSECLIIHMISVAV